MRRSAALVVSICLALEAPAWSSVASYRFAELDIDVSGVAATVDPAGLTAPKNTATAVRVVVTAGDRELSALELAVLLGGPFQVRGELDGPGLAQTISLPAIQAPVLADPLLIAVPALSAGGEYTLRSLRIEREGQAVLDVAPQSAAFRVLDQILITSVKTRPLTLSEIQDRGIVLDSDSYLGFEFTMALLLDSKPVTITMPVMFDRAGVAVPPTIPLPPPVDRQNALLPPLPTIVPVLLSLEDVNGPDGTARIELELPSGEPVRIPSVIVIPGDVGYLKQHFSAELFVANGAPIGSSLTVHGVTGTLKLPAGPDGVEGTADDPLVFADTVNGLQPATMPVRGIGSDGHPGGGDDVDAFRPAEQGQAEFLVRAEAEGFHTLELDVAATLDGLPVGPVKVKGKARGGVLVRNPYFQMAFTVPTVVRAGEPFKVTATVTNIGPSTANGVTINLDANGSGAHRACTAPCPALQIGEIAPGDAKSVELDMMSERTGQVTASYLKFTGSAVTGGLHFKIGVDERGVPLSPDTLVLPTGVESLPEPVVAAAMRVLGQAWSLAKAPPDLVPSTVARMNANVVVQKAVALAEAGLRVKLGQPVAAAVRDLAFDLYGGTPLDTGFDTLLRSTQAGRALAAALGAQLSASASDVAALEDQSSEIALSGPDFLSLGVRGTAGAVTVRLRDAAGRVSDADRGNGPLRSEISGVVFLPLGAPATAPHLAIGPSPAGVYTLEVSGPAEIAVTFPVSGSGMARSVLTTVGPASIVLDPGRPLLVAVGEDADANGSFEIVREVARTAVTSPGPSLLSAQVIGPETVDGAAFFGQHVALLFDRVVDATSAADVSRYSLDRANAVRTARRQLSGRLVFAALEQPEGSYVPAEIEVAAMRDVRGAWGAPSGPKPLLSRITAPGGVVSGRIVNADGAPAAGVRVFYWNWVTDKPCEVPLGEPAETAIAAVTTAADGRYEFRYVNQNECGGPFRITVNDPVTTAERSVTRFVRTPGEEIVVDIAMLGRGRVTGRVLDDDNDPVAGARVVAVSATDPEVGGEATSDGDGRYSIANLTVGAINVTAGNGLFVGKGAGRIASAGTAAQIDVRLEGPAARIFGKVSKQIGAGTPTAVPGATVLYSLLQNGNTELVGVARTDDDGHYELKGMPAGQFLLEAALNSRDRARIVSTITQEDPEENPEEEYDLVIEVASVNQTGKVRGTVRLPNGQLAAGAVVDVDGHGVLTAADGTFTIDHLHVPLNPKVSAQTRDGLRTGYEYAVLSEAQPEANGLQITLSGLGDVRFVVRGGDGQTLARQPVSITSGCSNPCGCNPTLSDDNGIAWFRNVRLGTLAAKTVRQATGGTDAIEAVASVWTDGGTGTATLQLAGFGTVRGLVKDQNNQPVAGALVRLSSRRFVNDGRWTCGLIEGGTREMRTETDGTFRFTGVNGGPVSVVVRHEILGASTFAQGTLTISPELHFNLTLAATTAGTLAGTIYTPDGITPVGAGVEVTANGPLPDITVRTNAQGQYELAPILPQGRYQVTARDAATGETARSDIYLRAAQSATHDLRLLGRGRVIVRVVDGAGQPAQNALVRMQQTQYPFRTYEGSVQSANGGLVTFEPVFEGPFGLEVSDVYGRGGRTSSILSRPGDTIEVKVGLSVTGRIAGTFRMPPSNTAIPFGQIRLIAGGRTLSQTTTDEAGAFAFDYVPAGPVRLEALDPKTARSGVAVGAIESEGQVLTLDVVAQALGMVRGLVTSNAAAQGGAHVEVTSGSYRINTKTDPAGEYVVEGVPEGRVTVTASLESELLRSSVSGALKYEDQELILDVALREWGEVEGVVTEADEVTPARAVVELVAWGVGGGIFSKTTDEEGTFSLTRVPSGEARISADELGSIDLARTTVQVPAGGKANVEIPLNGVGAITGEALGSGGSATGGTLILSGTGTYPYYRSLNLGANGHFAFAEVLAGPFTATLRTLSGGFLLYGTASGTVVPGQTATLQIQLQPSATITGTIRWSDGETAALGARVTLAHQLGTVVADVGPNGVFTFKGVPLGDFTLRVFDEVTLGRVVVRDQELTTNGQILNVGTFDLDDKPPVLQVVDPAPSSSRPQLAGRIELTVTDVGSGVDASTIRADGESGPANAVAFSFNSTSGTAISGFEIQRQKVGLNRVTFRAMDLAGNTGTASVEYTATGVSVRGHVGWAHGASPQGLEVILYQWAHYSDNYQFYEERGRTTVAADGAYLWAALRPGQFKLVATDAATGFSLAKEFSVPDGGAPTHDLQLPSYGQVRGTVRRHGGAPASAVTLNIGTRSTVSAADGTFDLGLFSLGGYTLEANDARGDRGRLTVNLTTHAQNTPLTVTLSGVGALTVTVKDSTGAVVPGAVVTVNSSAPLSTQQSGTAPTGTIVFPKVLAGTITIDASTTAPQLAGRLSTPLADDQAKSVDVALEGAGRVVGRVLSSDGSVVAGAKVTIGGSFSGETTSATDGTFAFDAVRLGQYSLTAKIVANGDQGDATGLLLTANTTQTTDVTLRGLGTIVVTVRDAAGTLVDGATVRDPNHAGAVATTDAQGVAVLTNIPAGSRFITASHGFPTGYATGTLAPGATLPLAITLQAAGTIHGRVLRPDGSTPAAAVEVSCGGGNWWTPGQGAPFVTYTDDEGLYNCAPLPLGTYHVKVKVNGHVRALVPTVILDQDGSVSEVADIVIHGAGTVSGTVTNPQGAPVADVDVDLTSTEANPFGHAFPRVKTNANGQYSVDDVLVASFRAAATKYIGGVWYGVDATGTVPSDGANVTANLQLAAASLNLPARLDDANAIDWTVRADGSVSGTGTRFASGGAARLSLVVDGTAYTFVGSSSVAGTEESKREVVVRQSGLAGLDVTRKIYVPQTGYFVRYLDIFENTGAQPVTVDVLSDVHLERSAWDVSVVDSDASWAIVDDLDTTDYYALPSATRFAPLTVVSQAAGAENPVTTFDSSSSAVLHQRWNAITVPAGGRAAVMYVLSAQADRTRAHATAERLVQLPPEVLVGISSEEAAAVVNFAVPSNGVGGVAGLPPLDGRITGTVFAGDGETIATASGEILDVSFRSHLPYYGRLVTFKTSAEVHGTFNFVPSDYASVYVVPVADFDLTATTSRFGHALTATGTPPLGSFAAASVRDLSTLLGTMWTASSQIYDPERAGDGNMATYWRAALTDTAAPPYFASPHLEMRLPVAATIHEVRLRGQLGLGLKTARVEVRGVEGAVLWSTDVTLTLQHDADVPVPAIAGVRAVRIVSLDDETAIVPELIVMGEAGTAPTNRVRKDLRFDGTASLSGRVLRSDGTLIGQDTVSARGPAPGTAVEASSPANPFAFRIAPPGTYTLSTSGPGLSKSDTVTLSANTALVHDIVYPPLGRITGTTRTSIGQPTAAEVTLIAPGYNRSTTAPAETGLYDLADVLPGTYTASAKKNQTVITDVMTVVAGTITKDFVFPIAAPVRVTVTSNGQPLHGAHVYWRSPNTPDTGAGDAMAGLVLIPNVSGPTFTIRAVHPATANAFGEASGTIAVEGQEVAITVDVPAVSTVSGTVRTRNGLASGGVIVSILSADPAQTGTYAYVSASPVDGTYSATNVPAVPVRVRTDVGEYFGYGKFCESAERDAVVSPGTTSVDPLRSRGVISSADQRDLWQMALTAGQVVSFVIHESAIGPDSALPAPSLELYGPDGVLIERDDTRSTGLPNLQINFTAPAAGTYILSVRGVAGATGGYRLGTANCSPTAVAMYRRITSSAAVQGRIVREGTGAAVGGRLVRVTYTPTAGFSGETIATSASDGTFVVPRVPTATSVTVESISAGGRVLARATATTGAVDTIVDVPVTEAGLGVVDVTALCDGAPCVGLSVTVTSTNGIAVSEALTQTESTGSTGVVSFVDVPVGTVTATATRFGIVHQPSGSLTDGGVRALEMMFVTAADTTPPAAVSDLSAQSPITGHLRLGWTAPGGDGTSGQAFEYSVRCSTTAITDDASFAGASALAMSSPAPVGQSQILDATFSPGTYYCALKTRDEAGNWSALSNVTTLTLTGLPVGATLWLRADAGVTADVNGYVSGWADGSGLANHAFQAAAARQPRLVPAQTNGLPVVRFDATANANDYVDFTTRVTTIRTAFWVIKERQDSPAGWRFLLGDSTWTSFMPGSSHQIWAPSATVMSGETRLNGAYVNGTGTDRPNQLSVLSLTTTANVAAMSFSNTAQPNSSWDGDLAELILFNRVLTDAEIESTEAYLARKYALYDVPYNAALPVPAIAPNGGVVTAGSPATVTITAAAGAEVRYTVDGSEPTATSALYTSSFTVSSATTVKAKAFKNGHAPSRCALASFLDGTMLHPAAVSGLKLWMRADAGVSVDAMGRVSQIADQSGLANHLIQADAALRPIWTADGVNGRPSLRFDGSSDLLPFTNGLTTIRSVFWVLRESPSSTTAGRQLLSHSSLNHFSAGDGSNGRTLWYGGGASPFVLDGETRLNGTFVDGSLVNRPQQLALLSLTTTGNTAATQFGRVGYLWWGDLAELIIYDRVVTLAERAELEEYLVAKYGLTTVPVVAPRVSPSSGSASAASPLTVSIEANSGHTVRYTTDGSEPTATSTLYAGPFTLTAATTVKAKAFVDGRTASTTSTAQFVDAGELHPSSLGGLKLWLRADVTGTTSGAVHLWSDLSGNWNDATQPTATARPEWRAAEVNGRPVVRFDGTTDSVSFSRRLTSIRTVFWVVNEKPAVANGERFLLGDILTNHFQPGSAHEIWTTWSTARQGETRINGGIPIDGATTARPTTLSVLSLVTAAPLTADVFGKFRNSQGFWFGDLAELLVYDRVLTDAERRAVEAMLATRYALYLPAAAAPQISPAGGIVNAGTTLNVTIAGEAGATVRYTTDGSDPTVSSTEYTAPFSVSTMTTVKARAFKSGYAQSPPAIASFLAGDGYQPAAIPGLKLWIRADAGLNGDENLRVTGIQDVSGNGNHLTQSDFFRQPRFVASVDGGRPGLRFDGTADRLDFATRLTSIRTVYWVIRERAGSPANARYLLVDTNSAVFYGGAAHQIWWSWSNDVTNGVTRLNGDVIDGKTTARPLQLAPLSVVAKNAVAASAFGGTGSAADPWDGDLAELMIFDRALSGTELAILDDYVAFRYGLSGTIPLGAPTITPVAAGVTAAQPVTVTLTAPAWATLRYTLDGSEPTEASPLYSAPFVLSAPTTVKARSYANGRTASPTAVGTFTDPETAPGGVTGALLWVRSDRGVTADGSGFVSAWADQTASANNLSQATSSARPKRVTSETLGVPVIRFDGFDDVLNFTTRLTTIRTAFWVVNEKPGIAGGWRSLLGNHGEQVWDFYGGSPHLLWSTTWAAPAILNGVTRVNGIQVVGTTTNRPSAPAVISVVTTGPVRAFNFSSENSTAGSFWNGDLYELVIYDRALTPPERQAVEQYLGSRYGITLP